MKYEEIVERLGGNPRNERKGTLKMKCPCHNDLEDSLSVTRGKNGKTVINCFAHCDPADILATAGLKMQDLFEDSRTEFRKKTVKEFANYKGASYVAHYDYYNAEGYAFTKVRTIKDGKKSFRYCILNSDLTHVDQYKLPTETYKSDKCALFQLSVLEKVRALDGIVLIVEGEKDAINAVKDGFSAVTAGSAGDWLPDHAEYFRGMNVIIVPDNDKAGKSAAADEIQSLKDVTKTLRIVKWPEGFRVKGDYSDFVEMYPDGEGTKEFQKLIDAAAEASSFVTDLEEKPQLFLSDEISEKDNDSKDETQSDNGPHYRKNFYKYNEKGNPTDTIDAAICDFIVNNTTFFIMGREPYIYADGMYKYDKDGNFLKRKIQSCIVPVIATSVRVTRIYNLLLMQDKSKDFDSLNQYPAYWICAQNGMYDPITDKLLPHDPKYYCINQLPVPYIKEAGDCPCFKSFIESAIPDNESREMLLEYFGLCLTRDARQQKFMILKGIGGTGKSTLIRVIESIVGSENCSNISMQQLNQRFYCFGLLGRLLNTCADIPSEAMKAVDVLKKITGEDTLQAEAKGKDAFYFKNYAKMLFSANSIPLNLDEATTAFYRRMLIVTMDSKPQQVDNKLFEKLDQEKQGIFIELIAALQRLYKRGSILISEQSKAAVKELYHASDTAQAFIDDCMISDVKERVSREDLFCQYEEYCKREERKPLTRNNLFKNFRAKGFSETKGKADRYFIGIGFKDDGFMPMEDKDIPFPVDSQ